LLEQNASRGEAHLTSIYEPTVGDDLITQHTVERVIGRARLLRLLRARWIAAVDRAERPGEQVHALIL
jgi:hypothetical protein